MCGLLCDCAELDDTVDKIFNREKVPDKRGEVLLQVVEDRLRLPWPRGAIKLPIDKLTPWLAVPVLFRLASNSWLSQVLIHGMVLPLLIACKYKTCLMSSNIVRPRTKFFLHWSLATFACNFYIYQVHVVGLVSFEKKVSPLENLCLIGIDFFLPSHHF